MKQCSTCKELKSSENFYRSKQRKDGLCPICKTCEHDRAVKRYKETSDKEKERRKKYYTEHKEEVLVKAREYHAKTYPERKEKINLRNRESYQRNKERAYEYDKRYRQRTRPYQTAKTRKRQALMLQRLPKGANLSEIQKFYDEARRLTLETGIKHEVDHIIPLQGKNVSGFHVEWNLQILTKSENSSKGNKN